MSDDDRRRAEERERMRRADEAARAKGRENNLRGEYFHRGMAQIRGETRENGWAREYVEPHNEQRLDQARVYVNKEDRAFREYKSGRIDERSVEQLRGHRELLDKGIYRSGEWVTVTPLEKAPKEFRDLVAEMQRELNFRLVVVPPELTARAMELGEQLTPGARQLELVSSYELYRQERARQRLEKIREIVKAREAAEKQPPAVAKERTEPAPKVREARERDEAQAREMIDRLGGYLSDAQKQQVLAALREARDSERHDVVLETKPVRGQEPPAPPPVPQRTPEPHENALARAVAERERAQAAAKEAGLSPQIMGILGLNSKDPPKMIDADAARTHAESERDRAIHQQRERERAERERASRHRGE
ncbi:hypothetical protein AB0E01_22610 [Nocardia vinacea]|uniref:hypothetical protein n=1 Tax=Nocardia vinacea TaxID=96468 RepID=UPI0033FD84D0